MPNPTLGFLAKVSIKDPPGSTFVDLPDTVTFNFPDLVSEVKEDKRLTAGLFKQKFAGMAEFTDVECEMYYTKAGYQRVRGLFRVSTEFRLFPPDEDGSGTALAEMGTITGFISKVKGPKFVKGDENMCGFTLTVNGALWADATNNPPAAPSTP